MISPTVGRVVWYWNNPQTQKQPNAAIVAFVHTDTMVNLAVFDNLGIATSLSSVYLYQGEGERPTRNFCEWMPYQVGQAKAAKV